MMKSLQSKSKIAGFAVFALSFLLAAGAATPSALAAGLEELDGVNEVKNGFLDGLEDAVRNTGLGDFRDQLQEDYGVTIRPYFKTRFDLTSNVFKAPDTDSDHTDVVWSWIPGVQWAYKNKYGVIGGAYEAIFRYFTQFSQQNEQDQKFLVYANLFPTENTYIRVTEKFDQVGATAGSSAFEPVNYFDNRVSVVVGYKADRFTYEFGYENFDRDFSATVARRYSYNEDRWDYRVYYQLRDDTRVHAGLRLGDVGYAKVNNRDTFYQEYIVGIESKLPAGFVLSATAGLHHRNLEAEGQNDLTNIVTNIAASRRFNDNKTTLSGGFLRRPVESSFSTTTTYDEKLWYLNLKHLFQENLRGRASLYAGNRDWEDRVLLGSRVLVGGAVFVVSPQSVKRDDDVFGYGVGFDYTIRDWWVAHIDYNYSRRNSNISALDYTEHVFSLRNTIQL